MPVDLLVIDDDLRGAAPAIFGGRPPVLDADGFAWPRCATCAGPLQYQGRVPHPIDAGKDILFFQCANDPGMCDEWDQKAGGNAAIVVAAGAESYAVPPAEGITSLHGHWSGHVVAADADTYDQARADSRGDGLAVLGCLGGEPGWIQDDETPTCSACGQPMILAAQLEESADRNSFNFGGAGCGYIFACTCPGGTASFLWQC